MTPEIRFIGLSKSARYALKALAYLAHRQGDGFLMTDSVSIKTGVPANYLAKLFQKLTHAGAIESRRGRRGGVRLAVDPRWMTLAKIVLCVDSTPSEARPCLLDIKACSSETPCLLHHRVVEAERSMTESLSTVTLADFAKSVYSKDIKETTA